jgi:hypothetical protein
MKKMIIIRRYWVDLHEHTIVIIEKEYSRELDFVDDECSV